MTHKSKFRITYTLYLLASLIALGSCVDDYNVDIPSEDTHRLVVDGNIRSNALCNFYLMYTVPLDQANQSSYYGMTIVTVDNATISVHGEDGTVYEGRRMGSNYQVQVGLLAPNVKYWLRIQTPEGTFESAHELPIVSPPISDITFQQADEQSPVQIYVKTASPDPAESIYLQWTYDEMWEIYTPYTATYEYSPYTQGNPSDGEDGEQLPPGIRRLKPEEYTNHGWVSNYSSSENFHSSESFANNVITALLHRITPDDNRLQTLYRITVHQRAISKAEYEYIKLRNQQSHGMSGLFTPLPSELPSNIHCVDGNAKAIGYVGISGDTSSKQLYIPRNQIHYIKPYRQESYTDAEMTEMGLSKYDSRLNAGFRLMYFDDQTHESRWAPSWCVDVRDYYWGRSSLARPDSWPDNTKDLDRQDNPIIY